MGGFLATIGVALAVPGKPVRFGAEFCVRENPKGTDALAVISQDVVPEK
jgi:hypothetical protein